MSLWSITCFSYPARARGTLKDRGPSGQRLQPRLGHLLSPMEMVHDDVGVVFLASLLGEDRVEPLLVISGNEMAPLDDFQSFLAAPTPFLERGKWGRVPPVRRRRLPSRNPCERFHDSFF